MKKEYYRTIFRGPDMDTETVFKIIEMLDARIDHIKLNQPVPILKDWHNGLVYGLEEFRDHLQNGFIEPKVNQVEDQGGY